MDFYYRKLMGNGAITSKFKLSNGGIVNSGVVHLNPSNVRDRNSKTTEGENDAAKESTSSQVEFPDTHHTFNCDRCYKLKKKCLRLYPKCVNCSKADTDCEYIDRSNKRRKKANNKTDDEKVNGEEKKKEAPIFHIINEKGERSSEGNVVAHKLVTVSSLLSAEGIEQASGRIANAPERILTQLPNTRRVREVPRDLTVSEKLAMRSLNPKQIKTNLKEEFVTMKAMDEDLPLNFILSYFHNYGTKYPFIIKEEFMAFFDEIDFKRETIINLDVYLLMSIGCLIYDNNNSTELFNEYFNENTILSVMDILNFGRNNNEEEDFGNLRLMLLMTIYAISAFNDELCWGLTGIMDRLIIELNYYKPIAHDAKLQQRVFWSVFNLDSELSLLLTKPSQLPTYDYIKLELPRLEDFDKERGKLISTEIDLHKFQHKVLDLKLRGNNDAAAIRKLSQDLESWRVTRSLAIHTAYSNDASLLSMISLVNLNYYYLSIELDQVSASESLQFTLQFLSNSFTLLVKDLNADKPQVSLSINSLFWYTKFFNVIKYNMKSLLAIVSFIHDTDSMALKKAVSEVTLKLSDFNSNLQLTVNLLRYLSLNIFNVDAIKTKIDLCIDSLNSLNLKLLRFNIFTCTHEDKLKLLSEVESINAKVHADL